MSERKRYGDFLLPHLGQEPPRYRVGDVITDGAGNRVRVTKVDPPEAVEADYRGPFTLTVVDDD